MSSIYHITHDGKRTSVSIGSTLNAMFLLRIEREITHPLSRESTEKAVLKGSRRWVRDLFDEVNIDEGTLSEYLQTKVLDFIMSDDAMPKLWRAYRSREKFRAQPNYFTKLNTLCDEFGNISVKSCSEPVADEIKRVGVNTILGKSKDVGTPGFYCFTLSGHFDDGNTFFEVINREMVAPL